LLRQSGGFCFGNIQIVFIPPWYNEIMDTQQSPNEQSEQKNKSNKNKLGLIFGAIIVLAVASYAISQSGKSKKIELNSNEVAIPSEQKAAQVPDDQRQALEADINKLNEQIKGFTDQTPAADKYKAYLQLSALYHRLGKYDEAISALDKIIEANKDKARLWIAYALIYKDKGDLEKAATNSKKALDLNIDNPQYWVVYLETEADLSNVEREAKFKEAAEKTENHEDVLVSYAKFLEKIGNKQGAIEQYTKAGETNQQRKSEFDAEIERLKK
jgi:tetratricopeptide (TPR) repeat protein